ncbi:MAG: hypothetical protein PHQ62_03510 [Clostridia bacterium]|nr:hypothetical protein [Clostridia bacterium]
MYVPRLRKINQLIDEVKKQDPNTAITYYLIETMFFRNQLSKIKWSNIWIVNLDELADFFTLKDKSNGEIIKKIDTKKKTTGYIYREFLKQDKDTMIRKTNMRTFSKQKCVKHTICQNKWLIDMQDLITKLNPKEIDDHKTLPRLRTKISAQNEWNSHHRKKIKHYIIDTICDSGKVFVYKHGKYNIINYDELEREIIKMLRENKKY